MLEYFSFNNLSIFFVLFGFFLNILTGLAAWVYFKKKKGQFYGLNLVYIIGFSLTILSRNWLLFLTGWELVTLSTALMLLWGEQKLAKQYFIIQFIGSSILFYLILLARNIGYTNLDYIKETWLQNLFILGLGVKSAIFGLHFWLAPIHSKAPAPVSGILSGWVVKLGFITLIRLIPTGNLLLLYLGLIMIIYGGIRALLATDYKVLLAFSSISQLGYIALGIGSGTYLGYLGSIYQLVAHGLAKTTLFIGSGYWEKEYQDRLIYNFKDALNRQPFISVSTITAFASLMGMFSFAGYNSKYLIKYGIHNYQIPTILFYGASLLTILYVVRFLWWAILKDWFKRLNLGKGLKVITANYPLSMVHKLSLFLGLILLLIFSFWPQVFFYLLNIKDLNLDFFGIYDLWKNVLLLIIGIVILYLLKGLKFKKRKAPSLDSLFIKSYKLQSRIVSQICLDLDSEKLIEVKLYGWLNKFARIVYNGFYLSFQVQLLWIPMILLFLLIWVRVAITNIL